MSFGEAVVGAGEKVVAKIKQIPEKAKSVARSAGNFGEDVVNAAKFTAGTAISISQFPGIKLEMTHEGLWKEAKKRGIKGKTLYDINQMLPADVKNRIRRSAGIDAAIRMIGATVLPSTYLGSDTALRLKNEEAEDIANRQRDSVLYKEGPKDSRIEDVIMNPTRRVLQALGEVAARVVPAAGVAFGVVTPEVGIAASELAVRGPHFINVLSLMRKSRALEAENKA